MDSILSSVLSIFSHNPIIVLGIIAYIAFSIIKSKNTEESDDYDNYESSMKGYFIRFCLHNISYYAVRSLSTFISSAFWIINL